MKREYPVIDTVRTGQNIKRIMLARGLTVRDIQHFLNLDSPQGIYHWFNHVTILLLQLLTIADLYIYVNPWCAATLIRRWCGNQIGSTFRALP